MHVNVDMDWRCHGRLHERMGHAVDVKVDDFLDKHWHIHKKTCTKIIAKDTYITINFFYSFPQHVATRKLQSYIKRRYPLACAIEQTGKTMFYATTKSPQN